MKRDMLKRIIAILLLGSLLLGLIPMIALATEADATIKQTVYKEGIGVRVAMSAPIDPEELVVTGPSGDIFIARRTDDGKNIYTLVPESELDVTASYTLRYRSSEMAITMSTPEASFADRVKMNNLSAAIVLTSQGIPFIHAGEEMLRSKPLEDGSFDHNSYRSSDAVNNLKWADMRGEEYQLTYAYYQGLIAFRKAHPALTMTSAGEVAEKITKLGGLDFNVVGFHIAAGANGEENELIVVFNPNPAASTVNLPEGQWTVYINGEKAGIEPLGTASGTATAEPISAMVLVKAASEAAPSIGIIGGADGPTAVLVSGNWGGLAAMAAAVLCAGIAVIVALKHRKK